MKSVPKKLLYIGHVWPEPASSAAGYRTMAILQAAQAEGWKVDFASSSEPTPWSIELKKHGFKSHKITINEGSFDKFIQEHQADFVVFDRFITEEQFGWRVEKYSPNSIRILDTIDLHFLRRERQKALNENYQFNLHSNDAVREISAIYRCDLSLIISSFEIQLLQEKFTIPSELLFYSPFMLQRDKNLKLKDFKQRRNFIMIGNFIHAPNWDAVVWCYKHIWPSIRTHLPDAELHVYGAYVPDKAKQFHQPQKGFHIMGRAEKLQELFPTYRLNLVPLRFGAGIKGKIADGFIYGTPCITTPIGAEGMAENLPWGGHICEPNEEFVKQAISLYQKPEEWYQCQLNGWQILEQVHNKDKNQSALINQLLKIEEIIQCHRKNNFIGHMLRYHFHRSTEFMSRWIEEKNKTV